MQTDEFLRRIQAHRSGLMIARSAYADRLAPGFSTFDFIRPDEMALSRIIAWMLSPAGSHGQGARFLSAFVDRFEIRSGLQSYGTAVSATEVTTFGQGRLDILVTIDDFAIAIENKVWANDQPKQVGRYLAHLDKVFPEKHCLIYLSAMGSPPSDQSISSDDAEKRIAKKQLLLLSYEELIPWVAECKSLCRADRVTVFLDEFIGYIEKQFLGVEDVNERNLVVAAITNSPEMLEAALHVIAAADSIKAKLFSTLEAQLQAAAGTRGWRVESTLQQSTAWTGVAIYYNAADHMHFSIQFATRAKAGLVYGVQLNEQNESLYKSVHQAVTIELGTEKVQQSETWPWYRPASPNDELLPVEGNWSVIESPWLSLVNGDFADKVIKAAERFQSILRREGLSSGS